MASDRNIVELLEVIAKHKALGEIAKSVGISREEAQKLIQQLKTTLERKPEQAVLIVDGSSKGNPGQAGAGIVLCRADGSQIDSMSVPLGIKTNNEAEYLALINGLKRAKEVGIQRLKVFSDSELLVKQMRGEYQIKSKKILPLVFEAARLRRDFEEISFETAERSVTRCADKLARTAANAVEESAEDDEGR